MQISFCFCKTCIYLKILENIQISVNMNDRLDITDEYLVKCDFILNTVYFIDAAYNISLRKFWKCNVLWFYLFDQGVPNETKGTINLKSDVCKWSGEEALFVCQWLVPVRVVGPQSVGFIGWLEFKGRIIHCIDLVCDSGYLVSLLVEQLTACKQNERLAKY